MEEKMSEFVRSLRRQLGMTQEEFAHAVGITVGTVNRWENGRFRPSKLARATIIEFARRHGSTMNVPDLENGSGQTERIKAVS
jgi:putative transcriptional regulator